MRATDVQSLRNQYPDENVLERTADNIRDFIHQRADVSFNFINLCRVREGILNILLVSYRLFHCLFVSSLYLQILDKL